MKNVEPVKSPSLIRPGYIVLLALAAGERHGYAIMKFAERISEGAIHLSAGTLYRTMARLAADGLVEEVGGADPSAPHDSRRRYYQLSRAGRRVAIEDTSLLRKLIAAANSGDWQLDGNVPSERPEGIHRKFEDAFNAADLDGLLALYEPDAALISSQGDIAVGRDQIGRALQELLETGGKLTVDTQEVVRVDELAQLTQRWSLTGSYPDGTPLQLGAHNVEVVRRHLDGTWRFVLDRAIGPLADADGG